jgi:hypothetical protein
MRHVVDVRVRGSAAPGTSEFDLAHHRAQLASAAGPALVNHCESAFDRTRLECVLAASTGSDVDGCAEQGGAP